MTAKKKDDTEDKTKVFDVSKPGESAPSATARPIIVNRSGSLTQDPMVKPESNGESKDSTEDESDVDEQSKVTISGKEKTIEPSKEMIEEVEKSKNDVDEESGDDSTDAGEASEEEEIGSSDSIDSDSGAVDAIADEVKTKAQAKKLSEEEAKKKAELQKIVDSKKYFVPINESAVGGSKGVKIILYILVSLVLLGIALNFAIDAGVIDVGIEPLTNLL